MLTVLSELAGKYVLYNSVIDMLPTYATFGHGLCVPKNPDLLLSNIPIEEWGDRLNWVDGHAVVHHRDGNTEQIVPEKHGSVYLFGDPMHCAFATGYFSGYDGVDVSSVFLALGSCFGSQYSQFIKLIPNI